MVKLPIIFRYIAVILAVLAINVTVFTLSPGNLISAIIPSIIILSAFLPAKAASNDQKNKKKSNSAVNLGMKTFSEPLAYEELSRSLDSQKIDKNESEFHSTLGNVFNTMAQNAGQDLYSSEITGTNGRAQNSEEKRESHAPSLTVKPSREENKSEQPQEDLKKVTCKVSDSKKPFNYEFFLDNTSNIPVNVKLEVGSDGKLHYIFQENEVNNREDGTSILLPNMKEENSGFNIRQSSTEGEKIITKTDFLTTGLKMVVNKRIKNIDSLYSLVLHQDSTAKNRSMYLVLTRHLDKIKLIIDCINDNDELSRAKVIWDKLENLLQTWLLEERGILYSCEPDDALCGVLRKVKLPDSGELQYGQLNNYLGKFVSMIRFLNSSDSNNWLKELYGVIKEIKELFPEDESECLQAIKLESVNFLGECIRGLVYTDSNRAEDILKMGE
ncbi:MAG: hypothetical protein ACFFD4_07205 [Candidatus Odinarchaeota archaeon]